MCFRNWALTSNPYFCLTAGAGNWFTGHIPSSARQRNPAETANNSANRFTMSILIDPFIEDSQRRLKKNTNAANALFCNQIEGKCDYFAFRTTTSLCDTN
jgi:hypothetical protein